MHGCTVLQLRPKAHTVAHIDTAHGGVPKQRRLGGLSQTPARVAHLRHPRNTLLTSGTARRSGVSAETSPTHNRMRLYSPTHAHASTLKRSRGKAKETEGARSQHHLNSATRQLPTQTPANRMTNNLGTHTHIQRLSQIAYTHVCAPTRPERKGSIVRLPAVSLSRSPNARCIASAHKETHHRGP